MESSIAEFLMRQFAFEQLPTYRTFPRWLCSMLIYMCDDCAALVCIGTQRRTQHHDYHGVVGGAEKCQT